VSKYTQACNISRIRIKSPVSIGRTVPLSNSRIVLTDVKGVPLKISICYATFAGGN